MKLADKQTLEVFAGRTGMPYGKLLKESACSRPRANASWG